MSDRYRVPFVLGASALVLVLVLAARPDEVLGHAEKFFSREYLSDDSYQHIWPYLSFYADSLRSDDILARYYLDLHPKGYYFANKWLAFLVDPRFSAKVASLICLLATVALAFVAAWRLAGLVPGLIAAVLVIASDQVVEFLLGGHPRTYAYPLTALMFVGLVYQRPGFIAAATALGAAFYYIVAVISGLVFACLLLAPKRFRGVAEAWSLRKRIGALAACAVVSLLLIGAGIQSTTKYGPLIDSSKYDIYPEAGPGGRYHPVPTLVARYASKQFVELIVRDADSNPSRLEQAGAIVRSNRVYIGFVLLVLASAAAVWSRNAKPVLVLLPLLIATILYVIASFALPYLYFPQRYLEFVAPLTAAILLPWAVCWLTARIEWLRTRPLCARAAQLSPFILLLAIAGGRTSEAGLVKVPPAYAEAYAALARLDKRALVAGWPDFLTDGIQYHAGRSALLTYETHQMYHEGFVIEMRERMNAIIDAFCKGDVAAALSLREKWGVTHLIINGEKAKRTDYYKYFRPFSQNLKQIGECPGLAQRAHKDQTMKKVSHKDGILILEFESR
jgi:hypothetical protein